MSTLSLRLPDSLHDMARKLAKEENVSINHLISTAVAEKLSALATETYLAERAAKGSRKEFDKIMSRVPNVPPDPGDEI
ncbi:MAG: toxin-antitoxin system HicB family antitoxin [Kiritimatiellia bacterium]